ncbi:MAG: TPM domain-containing protein [Bacteroidales bacterium]|jgi:uncharacterized protein
MKRKTLLLASLLFVADIASFTLSAQDFPAKPVPPRLVNDFAGMLTGNEINALEQKLVAFDDSTSTQVAIVTVSDLKGYDKGDYAQRLAQLWGIGQKGHNNGILVLIKPRTENSSGQVFIAPGYGLEGAIPDQICAEIIDREILPAFRAGQYYNGLEKATNVLMSLARGDFPADKYHRKGKSDVNSIMPFIVLGIFIVTILFSRIGGNNNQRHISSKGLPFWMLMSMMNSRNSHGGSWGGFSGGGGGGFGGFGGGSFGGGGAGGSW